jgi:Amt family ammonium transporter
VVVTFVILKIVDAVVGLRVAAEDELSGLDLTQHAESAYALGGSPLGEHVLPGRTDEPAAATSLREVGAR